MIKINFKENQILKDEVEKILTFFFYFKKAIPQKSLSQLKLISQTCSLGYEIEIT
jgi:hypothetical protein